MATKTKNIRETIFLNILRGKYGLGDKLPTEREVALNTKTSRITVRRAFSELEQAGILHREQGKGTFVSTDIQQGNGAKIKHIGLLTAIRKPFTEFLVAFQNELNSRDVLFVMQITDQNPTMEQEAAVRLVAQGIKNLIIWPSCKDFPAETFMRMRVLGTNMVFLDRMLPGPYADFVGLDNYHAVNELVDYAQQQGKEKLTFVSHSGLGAFSDYQREDAFEKLCSTRGIPYKIFRVPWLGDVDTVLANNKNEWFVDNKKTGIICVNDNVACKVKSHIGNEFAIYGIDGRAEALQAGIPTIKQPLSEMASQAVDLIYRQQKEAALWKSRHIYCKGKLLIPGSSDIDV